MERIIKFRRAHFDFKGRFMHFDYWGKMTEGMFCSPSSNSHENTEAAIDLQFTGLLDKNGKEVYEGDILKYTYHRDRSGKDIAEFTEAVEWNADNDNWSGFRINKKMSYEIIGNIYENPTLLC